MDLKEILLGFIGGFSYGSFQGLKEYKKYQKDNLKLRKYSIIQYGFKNGFNILTFISLFQFNKLFLKFENEKINNIISSSISGGICGLILKNGILGILYGAPLGLIYSYLPRKKEKREEEIQELKEIYENERMNQKLEEYIKEEEIVFSEIEKFLKK